MKHVMLAVMLCVAGCGAVVDGERSAAINTPELECVEACVDDAIDGVQLFEVCMDGCPAGLSDLAQRTAKLAASTCQTPTQTAPVSEDDCYGTVDSDFAGCKLCCNGDVDCRVGCVVTWEGASANCRLYDWDDLGE